MSESFCGSYKDKDSEVFPLARSPPRNSPNSAASAFDILHTHFTQWIQKQKSPMALLRSAARTFESANYPLDFLTNPDRTKFIQNETNALSKMINRVRSNLLVDKQADSGGLFNAPSQSGLDLKWIINFNRALGECWKEVDDPKLTEHIEQLRDLFIHFLVDSFDIDLLDKKTGSDKKPGKKNVVEDEEDDEDDDGEKIDISFIKNMSRSFLWSFDGIRMLIESSLPMFGMAKHPLITLQLGDVRDSITIFVGLNCLLETLIGEVPDLAMCYHIDDDVQRYDLIRVDGLQRNVDGTLQSNTPDPLPSANLVKSYAPNILNFVKEKANRTGHIYWLFKSCKEDKVRLYDLTSTCNSFDLQNPYAYPIVELIYRVCYNLCKSNKARNSYADTTYSLLTQCLNLARERKFSDLQCYASFLLSDFILNEDDKFINADDIKTASITENLDIDCITYSLQVLSLHSPEYLKEAVENPPKVPKRTKKSSASEYTQDLHDRATRAIEKLSEALEMHQRYRLPIPLVKKALENEQDDTDLIGCLYLNKQFGFQRSNRVIIIPTLLLQKAFASYMCLANSSFAGKKYGRCIRCLKIALNCMDTLCHLARFNDIPFEICRLILMAGDCYYAMSNENISISSAVEQYQQTSENDRAVEESADALYGDERRSGEISWNDEIGWMLLISPNHKQLLPTADRAFYMALELCGDRDKTIKSDCLRRLISCRNAYANELLQFVNDALGDMSLKILKEGEREQLRISVDSKLKEAHSVLESALQELEGAGERDNRIMVLMNAGKLYKTMLTSSRVFSSDTTRSACSPDIAPYTAGAGATQEEIEIMAKIVATYRTAEELVRSAKNHVLLEEVSWEKATNGIWLAISRHVRQQDHFSIDQTYLDALTEIISDLKALNPSCPQRQVRLFYLLAFIYHRIASMYANATHNTENSVRKVKQYRGICKTYYENAVSQYRKILGTSKNLPITAMTELVARKADCANHLLGIGMEIFAQTKIQWDLKTDKMITKAHIQQRINAVNALVSSLEDEFLPAVKAVHAEQPYKEFLTLCASWTRNVEEGVSSILEALELSSNPKTKEMAVNVCEQLQHAIKGYGKVEAPARDEDIHSTKKVFESLIGQLLSMAYTFKP